MVQYSYDPRNPPWNAKMAADLKRQGKLVGTFIGEMKKAVSAGVSGQQVLRTEEDADKILHEICQNCEHFDLQTLRCRVCGCFLKFKTRLLTSHCPVNKW